jgi:hypothetical protein
MYLRFCTQVRLKFCWLELRLFLQLHTHWPLERFQQSQTLVLLFRALLCTKYFKDKAEVCNLSIFNPKKPDLLFESRLYDPQNILSTFDKHHPNTSWYFESLIS